MIFVLRPTSWTDHCQGRQPLLGTDGMLSLIGLLLLHQQSHPDCTLALQVDFPSTSTALKSALSELVQGLYNTLPSVVVNVADMAYEISGAKIMPMYLRGIQSQTT